MKSLSKDQKLHFQAQKESEEKDRLSRKLAKDLDLQKQRYGD